VFKIINSLASFLTRELFNFNTQKI